MRDPLDQSWSPLQYVTLMYLNELHHKQCPVCYCTSSMQASPLTSTKAQRITSMRAKAHRMSKLIWLSAPVAGFNIKVKGVAMHVSLQPVPSNASHSCNV